MKAKNLLRMLATLALASAFPGLAFSQALKTAIVGTWSVASVVDQYENGKKINNWGTAKGNFFFAPNGRFGQIIIGDAQPGMKTADPRKPDAPVVAYYGTYTVNEGNNTISFMVEAASYSSRVGGPVSSSVELKGDTMTIIGSPRKDQVGTFHPRLELKRVTGL